MYYLPLSVFLDKGLKFQPGICNGCYDVLMMSINLNDIAISNIHGIDYCCIISGTSKSEAVNLLQKKWSIVGYKFSLEYVKDG